VGEQPRNWISAGLSDTMNGMKVTSGVLALFAIGMVGCNKGGTNNSPSPDLTKPVSSGVNNSSEANNSPSVVSNENPAGNNAPVNTAPPSNANNAPASNPPVIKTPNPMMPMGPVIKPKKDGTLLPTVSGIEKDGWKKVPSNVNSIAATLDDRMKSVRDTKMEMEVYFELPTGHGILSRANIIADQKRFKLEYGLYTTKPMPHYETYFVIKKKGDTKYSTFDGEKYVSGRATPSADVLNGWILNPTQYLGNGIGTDKRPISELLQAAQKAHWRVGVEEKKLDQSVYQRIVMESPSQPTKRIELMLHPTKLLPVQLNESIIGTKRTNVAMRIEWSKSDKPLNDADLSPAVKAAPVNVISPEEAKKQGIKPTG
jgi:hypothetical protein